MWILLLQQALPQFSHMGYVAVALLGLTGVINTALLVGSVNGLVGLPYGRLLLVKICMFLVLVAVAIRNRMILSPQTKRARTASAGIAGLSWTVAIEHILGLGIIVVVSILGTWPPALHTPMHNH